MERTFRKDISELKTFTKYGDVFTQIRNNPETGWWLYERTPKDGGRKHFEVVKGRRHKNPDDSVVLVYPSADDWGIYGYTIPDCWWADETIDFIMGRKTTSAQELYEFKKTLKNASISPNIKEIREF